MTNNARSHCAHPATVNGTLGQTAVEVLGKNHGNQCEPLFLCRYTGSMDSSRCLTLALEGERLCKAGDFHSGVDFLNAAVDVGTEDTRVLSAIYSQLGNASFYLGDYTKALEYHQLDLKIAK